MKTIKKILFLVCCVGLSASACHPERPEGWTEETHGRNAQPAYSTVFSQDQVKRLDLVIDPVDWQTMLNDMVELCGEFGSGDPTVEQVPQEMIDACAD